MVIKLHLSLLEALLGFYLPEIPALLFVTGELVGLVLRRECPFIGAPIAIFDKIETFAARFVPGAWPSFFDIDAAYEVGDWNAHVS